MLVGGGCSWADSLPQSPVDTRVELTHVSPRKVEVQMLPRPPAHGRHLSFLDNDLTPAGLCPPPTTPPLRPLPTSVLCSSPHPTPGSPWAPLPWWSTASPPEADSAWKSRIYPPLFIPHPWPPSASRVCTVAPPFLLCDLEPTTSLSLPLLLSELIISDRLLRHWACIQQTQFRFQSVLWPWGRSVGARGTSRQKVLPG